MADTQTKLKLCTQTDPLTAPKPNFLRINAQMHNLDKQKTVPRRNTLAVIVTDDTATFKQTTRNK